MVVSPSNNKRQPIRPHTRRPTRSHLHPTNVFANECKTNELDPARLLVTIDHPHKAEEAEVVRSAQDGDGV
jgi:hypothetical protein